VTFLTKKSLSGKRFIAVNSRKVEFPGFGIYFFNDRVFYPANCRTWNLGLSREAQVWGKQI